MRKQISYKGKENNMSNIQNQTWIESATENFEEALQKRDWPTVRAVLSDIESAGFDQERKLRREMNKKMAEPLTAFEIMQAQTAVIMDSFKKEDSVY